MMFSRAKTALTALTITATIAISTPAQAKSVRDYEAMSTDAQAAYMLTFLEKMTYDIGQKNPELARRIKDYFVRDVPGKPLPEGIERVEVELVTVDNLAKQGKADLSKIQVEAIVVYVVKQKFPPDGASKAAGE